MPPDARRRLAPCAENDPRSHIARAEELVDFVGYRPNALLTSGAQARRGARVIQLLGGVTLRGDGLLTPGTALLICETARRYRYTTTLPRPCRPPLGVD